VTLMSKPILLAFCPPSDRKRVIEASPDTIEAYFDDDHIDISDELVVLLAIGGEGSASLVQWIGRHGLDSVIGIGLVGVTAPWADRGTCYGEWVGGSGGHKRWERCGAPSDYVSSFDADDADPEPLCQKHFDALNPNVRDMWKPARVLLGPLEPLRSVAEMCRIGKPCRSCRGKGKDGGCKSCQYNGSFYPWTFAIACASDDGACAACKGDGAHPGWVRGSCDLCDGDGECLSSSVVARELVGGETTASVMPETSLCGPVRLQDYERHGGLEVFHYPTCAALIADSLRSVIERLTR
jgi:hypothetical protein